MVGVSTDAATADVAAQWGSGTVREETLSLVLGEFARTLIIDFPVQGILDRFVKRIVEVLPISSAGVTLISAGVAPRYVAASDDAALRFEQLQSNIGEGPCMRAYETGQPVLVPDLRVEQRFPRFTPAALTAGLGAVFTFPLRDGDGRLGALDLYRNTAGALDEHDTSAAQTLADVAAAYLLNARARDELRASFDMFQRDALYDELTGVANRLLLQDRIERAAHIANGSDAIAAILLVDVDDFARINEIHGRQLGDQLLRAVAQRLSTVVDRADTLARFGDDKFVILRENMHRAIDVDGIAKRVDEALRAPFALVGADDPLHLTATIGVVFSGCANAMSNALVVDTAKGMRHTKRTSEPRPRIIDLRVDPAARTTGPRGRGT
ncbi:MAG: diguanylate cyclase [Acidimicrobiales bacterium]